jgi:hypothetical protein
MMVKIVSTQNDTNKHRQINKTFFLFIANDKLERFSANKLVISGLDQEQEPYRVEHMVVNQGPVL